MIKGLFSILNYKHNYLDFVINYIKNLKYYNVNYLVNNTTIEIYCNDYLSKKIKVCTICDNDIYIDKKFSSLIKIFRSIKIEYVFD